MLASDSDSDYSIVRESNGNSMVPSGRQSGHSTPKKLSKQASTIDINPTPKRAGNSKNLKVQKIKKMFQKFPKSPE